MPPFLGSRRPTPRATLNVSKFGPRLAGAGGFINISQNAKKVVFVGTFTAGDLGNHHRRRQAEDRPRRQGEKFVAQVEHRTFSGAYASKQGNRSFTSPSAASSG